MLSPNELLRKSPLFAPLAETHREQLLGHFVRHEYPREFDVIRQGDLVDAIYLIASGSVGAIVQDRHSGLMQLTTTFEAPESFGDVSLFTGGRDTTYTTLETSVVYRLAGAVFFAVAGQVPQVALAAARLIGERLTTRSKAGEIPWVSLAARTFDARLWSLASERVFREGRLVPLELSGSTLTVGMVDPQNSAALERLARAVSELRIKVVAVSADDWTRFVDSGTKRKPSDVKGDGKQGTPARPDSVDKLRVEDTQVTFIDDEEAPKAARATAAVIAPHAVAYVNEIISAGLAGGASDIHIEHDRRGLLVRYRIDGALRTRPDFLPSEVGKPLVSRLKLLAKLDITDTRKPQNGRISIRVGNRVIDLRLSTIPAKLGEKVVMRILDAEASIVDLKALISVDKALQLFSRMVFRPHGLVMVTGPTGSGKTTTLYSALNARRASELNIVTVEDPIEYHLDGITQIQVQPEIGNTFAMMLRSLLRQDPDIIMVGETRDNETAKMAIEASMTGHLVLTSAHSNGAAEAVVRLTDLGIDRQSVANALVGVIHQRLVRRICRACAEPFDYPAPVVDTLYRVGALLQSESYSFKRGRGCDVCFGTGFKGRAGLYELLVVNDTVRDAILARADVAKLNQAATVGGSLSLARYAGILLQSGVTAPSEVLHLLKAVEA
jgi:type IV pilus assembly protein PilB